MTLHRITLKLLAPLGTPLQSDTLFGHLCWVVVQNEGEAALQQFLEPFRAGAPPFVLSDGFPQGVLPKPLLPRLAPSNPRNECEFDIGKEMKKAAYLTAEQFCAVASAGSLMQFIEVDDKCRIYSSLPASGWRQVETQHAAIDRNTGLTGGGESKGRLYSTTGWIPRQAGGESPAQFVDLYARATDDGIAILKKLLTLLAQTGYGKDKSVGRGQFQVTVILPASELDDCPGTDGFVSLSSFVPAPDDPTDGRWKLRTKYGKLGEEWALSELPFKRPLLQFEPGAAFRTGTAPRGWYGSIVSGIAPSRTEVIQNCQTVALPVCWEGG